MKVQIDPEKALLVMARLHGEDADATVHTMNGYGDPMNFCVHPDSDENVEYEGPTLATACEKALKATMFRGEWLAFEAEGGSPVCFNCALDDPSDLVRGIDEAEIMDGRENATDWPACIACGERIS